MVTEIFVIGTSKRQPKRVKWHDTKGGSSAKAGYKECKGF